MAVNAIQLATDLILVMDNGIGAAGQQLSINRTYKDVKPNANNEDIYNVGESLISLQGKANLAIQRRDILELEQA
jgi:hypothetical protein